MMLMMPVMMCWEYLLTFDKRVDVGSDLKNSDVIVVVAIVGVVDHPLGGNPTA